MEMGIRAVLESVLNVFDAVLRTRELQGPEIEDSKMLCLMTSLCSLTTRFVAHCFEHGLLWRNDWGRLLSKEQKKWISLLGRALE